MMNTETAAMTKSMNDVLSGLRIDGECVQASSHRHMAFYDLRLSASANIRRLENRAREIACAIESKTIPIIKVIPELGVVRLQVATRNADCITFEDLSANEDIPEIDEMFFPMIIGETDEGEKLWMDMSKNPHLLVAGGTGSGKSVLLHTIITNAMMLSALGKRNISIWLSDPKRVEFSVYKNDCMALVHDYVGTVSMLKAMEWEMEQRYEMMEKMGIKSIQEAPGYFSINLVVIDEAADLIGQDKYKEFETLLQRLGQKARAAGIYMVLATQRPSAKILTGEITANFPGRIACKVASHVNSRVIIDKPGAENLLGRGDAILNNMEHDHVRFQVAFTDPNDALPKIRAMRN